MAQGAADVLAVQSVPDDLRRAGRCSGSDRLRSVGTGPDDACFATVESHIIARLNDALAAAADAGCGLGYTVFGHATPLSGNAAACGQSLVQQLRDGPAGLHIWGGETSVRLPERPGRGGRNQHLALAAATVLAGDSRCSLLCAGTDGSGGPGEDAGEALRRGRQWALFAGQRRSAAHRAHGHQCHGCGAGNQGRALNYGFKVMKCERFLYS